MGKKENLLASAVIASLIGSGAFINLAKADDATNTAAPTTPAGQGQTPEKKEHHKKDHAKKEHKKKKHDDKDAKKGNGCTGANGCDGTHKDQKYVSP